MGAVATATTLNTQIVPDSSNILDRTRRRNFNKKENQMPKKSPFEITASALKIMGKKVAAKKGTNKGPIESVFVPTNDTHAIATDGTILACLDLTHYGDFRKPEILEELAFYADMQVINFMNGHALITAEKKEEFIFTCGKGIDRPDYEKLEDTYLHYPEWSKILPPQEAIKNVSDTGAVFRPGEIGILDSVANAFDVLPLGTDTIANVLYGADSEGAHFCVLSGLMLVAYPLKSVDISVFPSKEPIQSFINTKV